MERTESQNQKILKWMKEKGSISPQEAMTFGCMRLAARINDLRRSGHTIISDRLEYVDNDGRRVSYASYRLGQQECVKETISS